MIDISIGFLPTNICDNKKDPQFFNNGLWSDQSTMKKDWCFNMNNLQRWQVSNQHLMREDISPYQLKINYWTGILNRLAGHKIFSFFWRA